MREPTRRIAQEDTGMTGTKWSGMKLGGSDHHVEINMRTTGVGDHGIGSSAVTGGNATIGKGNLHHQAANGNIVRQHGNKDGHQLIFFRADVGPPKQPMRQQGIRRDVNPARQLRDNKMTAKLQRSWHRPR